jgi:photosystem II S4 domain protein
MAAPGNGEADHGEEALAPLLAAAEQALRSWEPVWTDFLAAPLRELAERELAGWSELGVASDGGHPGAERRRLLLHRRELELEPEPLAASAAMAGLEISGNFLFDPAGGEDFRAALWAAGAEPGELGDLWLRGDRGAQAIVAADLAGRLDGREGVVRSVAVRFESRPIALLQLPQRREPKRLTSVEASCRLDAVASAGFGFSRSRMAELIRQGAVRLNWRPITSPSRELETGDRIQLDQRGELRIDSITATQRGRLRIVMERR